MLFEWVGRGGGRSRASTQARGGERSELRAPAVRSTRRPEQRLSPRCSWPPAWAGSGREPAPAPRWRSGCPRHSHAAAASHGGGQGLGDTPSGCRGRPWMRTRPLRQILNDLCYPPPSLQLVFKSYVWEGARNPFVRATECRRCPHLPPSLAPRPELWPPRGVVWECSPTFWCRLRIKACFEPRRGGVSSHRERGWHGPPWRAGLPARPAAGRTPWPALGLGRLLPWNPRPEGHPPRGSSWPAGTGGAGNR